MLTPQKILLGLIKSEELAPVGKLIVQRALLYVYGMLMGYPGRTTEAFDPEKDNDL